MHESPSRVLIVTQYFWPENFRVNELVLEFKLIMDNKRSDCDKIAYNIGNRCVLTAAQFLYAYEYNAFA